MTRQQFTLYVESYQKAVRRFLTALCCGDSSLADDLAQDTFVKAYLSCDGFREDSKFTTWIYRIAYNTFISHRRSSRSTVSLIEASTYTSLSEADGSFRYQALYAALDRLGDKERAAILLFYRQGYSVAERADISHQSTEAVKQQLSRGRKHVKQFLDYEAE